MPIDLSNAWKACARIINTGIALLPNIVLALIIFILFLILASASKSLTRRFSLRRRTHQGVALLISRLVQTSIVVLGFLIAFSVVAPSFQAADLIKMLDVGSVAADGAGCSTTATCASSCSA